MHLALTLKLAEFPEVTVWVKGPKEVIVGAEDVGGGGGGGGGVVALKVMVTVISEFKFPEHAGEHPPNSHPGTVGDG